MLAITISSVLNLNVDTMLVHHRFLIFLFHFFEQQLQDNGTLYIHVYVTKRGKSPDPLHPKFNRLAVVNRSLCKYYLNI